MLNRYFTSLTLVSSCLDEIEGMHLKRRMNIIHMPHVVIFTRNVNLTNVTVVCTIILHRMLFVQMLQKFIQRIVSAISVLWTQVATSFRNRIHFFSGTKRIIKLIEFLVFFFFHFFMKINLNKYLKLTFSEF